MENQLFSVIEPSENLRNSIINKIKKEEMKRTIYKIVFSSVVSLSSVSLAIFSITYVIKDAYQSGLSEYLSLLLSDGGLLVSYWQTYAMSIVESLPIVPITLVVASIWIFVWSVNSVFEAFKNTRSSFIKFS